MAINFPASPTNGQKLINGSVVYTYASATGSWESAPLGTAWPDNLIVNPEMAISAENLDVSGTTTGYYVADQWRLLVGLGTGVVTAARLLSASGNGTPYRLRILTSTIQAVLASGDHAALQQVIEGTQIARLKWGIAGEGIPAVLRFWTAGTSGLVCVATLRNATSHHISFPFTLTPGWVEHSFAIPAPPGTWVRDNTKGAELLFTFAAGSTYTNETFTGTWIASSDISLSVQSNGLATVSNNMVISDVGLHPDPAGTGVAPPWEKSSNLQVEQECQRHWYRLMGAKGVASSTTTTSRTGQKHPIDMRVTPAITAVGGVTIYDSVNNSNITMGTTYPNPYYAEYNGTITTLGLGRCTMQSQPAGAYIAVNARM